MNTLETTSPPVRSAAIPGPIGATPAFRSRLAPAASPAVPRSDPARPSGDATIADGPAGAGLSPEHATILEARGLDVELLSNLEIASHPQSGGDWIVIPYRKGGAVVNRKFRTITGDKKFKQDAGATKCFWNVDAIFDPTLASEPLIVTEGEFDAVAAMQAGFQRVVSVPDGAPAEALGDRETVKYSYITEDVRSALRDATIILATDSDAPGANLMHDLSHRLGRARCKWVTYPKGCKDLNDALRVYGVKGVTETIRRAAYIKIAGIFSMSELPPVSTPPALRLGLPGLDDRYRVRAGDFCVVTGIPSHGKSSFLNEIACRMIRHHGWKAAMASFEQRPQVDHRRNLRTWFHGKKVIDQTDSERAEADRWIEENFTFIVPGEDDDVTLDWILEKCAAAVIQRGVKLITIDPWNEMDHDRSKFDTLTEYTGYAIRQFKKFATKFQVHLIVAAHPAKLRKDSDGQYPIPTLYDISDSAHWYNKPEVGIVVHRTKDGTILRVAKVRYQDEIGEPGDEFAKFNPFTCHFTMINERTGEPL